MTEKQRGNPLHEGDTAGEVNYSTVSTLHRALLDPGFHAFLARSLPPHHSIHKAVGATPKGGIDLSQIMALLSAYGPLIMSLLQQWTSHPVPTPTPVPGPSPSPVPTPTPSPTPAPVPPPAPVPASRVIASGETHVLGIEGWRLQNPRDENSGIHYSLGAGTVASIIGGAYLGHNYRVHLDSTPKDANGVPFYNPDLGKQPGLFCQFPEEVAEDGTGKLTCGEGRNRVNHYITVDGREYGPMGDLVEGNTWGGQDIVGLSSEYDDAGMTPVIVVSGDIPLSEEHTFSYRAEHVAPGGHVTRFLPSPTFNIKPWGN
jgi:hypothetical protein